MARSRPALENAINEILRKHGAEGKRMSYRQAERITGLSPATVGELAKGNARTPETIRRFAVGLGEDPNRLLLLAGFVPEEPFQPATTERTPPQPSEHRAFLREGAASYPADPFPEDIELSVREWLVRFGRALAVMPPGRERDLWLEGLQRDTELLEFFLIRLNLPLADSDEEGIDGKA